MVIQILIYNILYGVKIFYLRLVTLEITCCECMQVM